MERTGTNVLFLDGARPAAVEPEPGDEPVPSCTVSLVGSFAVRSGPRHVDLPAAGQRLVALLALARQPLRRAMVSGTLWPDKTDDRAAANLRSTMWRLNAIQPGLVEATPLAVRLHRRVGVDLHDLEADARSLLKASRVEGGRAIVTIDAMHHLLDELQRDLLPDWYDDWLTVDRERLRQLRLHAMEALARIHLQRGDHASGLDAALAAVSAEPLRESAHRLVIEVHLAEGNQGEALSQYDRCRQLLRSELGIEPTAQLRALVTPDRALR